jgi:BASS family bile acid:Na+ symporter
VIAVFVLAGLAIGHLLGGPDPDQRTVLALSTATRHPGVALAIVGANFPGEKAALAAILLCLIWGTILSIPYVRWRRHRIQSGVADA